MREAQIVTPRRAVAFIAQLGHESDSLRYFEEIASGAAYEGRRDLGNTQPGDGRRYKGRGPIQLTGRANYRAAGRALGLNLEENPYQAARPPVGFRIAGWYWRSRDLNALADGENFREITRRINGGYNGWADRVERLQRARKVASLLLPSPPNPLTAKERKAVRRWHDHWGAYKRRGRARDLAWAKWWKSRVVAQRAAILAAVRATGWNRRRRRARYNYLTKLLSQ